MFAGNLRKTTHPREAQRAGENRAVELRRVISPNHHLAGVAVLQRIRAELRPGGNGRIARVGHEGILAVHATTDQRGASTITTADIYHRGTGEHHIAAADLQLAALGTGGVERAGVHDLAAVGA